MIVLGISEDLFDAGVTICDGTRVLFASNEERYTRRKNEGGFPRHALAAAFAQTGLAASDIDAVVASGLMTPPLPVRLFPPLHDWLFNAARARRETFFSKLMDAAAFALPVSHTSEDSWLRRVSVPLVPWAFRRELPGPLRKKPLYFAEHHTAHAAGAWALSGFDETLAITADGMGDGLSLTVSHCGGAAGGVKRLWSVPSRSSFGLFFEVLTEAFGFVSCRDEGKITGLAAHGDASRVMLPKPFHFENGELVSTGAYGHRGRQWAREALVAKYSREDIAAWAQEVLEECVRAVAKEWLGRTGLRRVVVAGGVFANVKLNERLHELDEVVQLFVYPNMGDGGLSLGAIRTQFPAAPERVQDVFWGDGYSEAEIENALRAAGLAYRRMEDEAATVGGLLAEGRIVARFQGRMEWGPRALGNRSILVRTTDAAVVERLNTLLRRSDFMPFAPAMLDEEADALVLAADAARHAAEFMTVCFRCTERMKREHPAVVHVDGTARAQLVRQESNPGLHAILSVFRNASGSSVVLNTSFNIHEEPIVRTPEEGISTFVRAGLDCLSIGPFLVERT